MSISKLLPLTVIMLVAIALVGCNKGQTSGGGANAAGTVVNSKCPIMGGEIDQANIKADLVVDFDGKKVGFCCPMCGPKWAKLSDDEKKAALAKVMPE